MTQRPGSTLDHAVARRLQDDSPTVPAYSTDESLADPLLSLLERRGVDVSVKSSGGVWLVTLFARGPRPETIATGSSRSRALAICRAVANVTGWPDQEESSPEPRKTAVDSNETERRNCTICGAPISRRSMRAARVLCAVCAWNEGKPALRAFEASRVPKSGRRRSRGAGLNSADEA